MHATLEPSEAGAFPPTQQAVAQYLLWFEMAGSDGQFDRLVDYEYRSARLSGRTLDDAIRRTLATAGRAMVLTTALLVVGYFVLLFSAFLGTAHVGLLTICILLMALFGDLVVLPSLLLVDARRQAAAGC